MSRLRHSVDSSKETSNIALNPPHYYQPQHPLFQPAEWHQYHHINSLLEYIRQHTHHGFKLLHHLKKQEPLASHNRVQRFWRRHSFVAFGEPRQKDHRDRQAITSFMGPTDIKRAVRYIP